MYSESNRGGEQNDPEKAAEFCRELGVYLSAGGLDKKRHRRSGGVDPVWNLRLPAMPLVARHDLKKVV